MSRIEFLMGAAPAPGPIPIGPMFFPQMGPAMSPDPDAGHADVIDAIPGVNFREDTAGFRQQRLVRGKPVGLSRGWRE